MEQWSTFRKVKNYVQNNLIDYYKKDVKVLKPRNHRRIFDKLEEYDRQGTDLDFSDKAEKVKEEDLDVYGAK